MYSEAEFVHLCLVKKGSTVEMMIKDNGRGFDLEKVQKGLGLDCMQEWAELSGGEFRVESNLGQGTTIHAIWNLS